MTQQLNQFEQPQGQPVTPQPEFQPVLPSGGQPTKRVGLFIILGFIIAGGVFGFYVWQKGGLFPVLPTPTSVPTATPDQTSTWQTYRNEKYGLEFKYPNNYEVIVDRTSHEDYADYIIKLMDSKTDAYIEIALTRSTFDISKIQERYAPTGVVTAPKKTIYGNNIFYYYGPGGGGVAYPDYYFYDLNGQLLTFVFFGPFENDKTPSAQVKTLEKQLLTSFKFVEPEICIQVITPARNPQTGEVRDFPTPCDVPEGWIPTQ